MTGPKAQVGTVNNQVSHFSGTDKSTIPQLVQSFPTTGQIMPTFKYKLIVIDPIYDSDCTVTFSKKDVTVFSPYNIPILIGWCETGGTKLWRFYLLPDAAQFPPDQPDTENALLSVYTAYEIPSVKALVRYLHADSGSQSSPHVSRISRPETLPHGQASPNPILTSTTPSWVRPSNPT